MVDGTDLANKILVGVLVAGVGATGGFLASDIKRKEEHSQRLSYIEKGLIDLKEDANGRIQWRQEITTQVWVSKREIESIIKQMERHDRILDNLIERVRRDK